MGDGRGAGTPVGLASCCTRYLRQLVDLQFLNGCMKLDA